MSREDTSTVKIMLLMLLIQTANGPAATLFWAVVMLIAAIVAFMKAMSKD